MKRRSFFGGLLAAIAGVFGGKAQATAFDPTKPDRDKRGDALCWVFRLDADKVYRLIQRGEEKPGDRIIMIGMEGKELWRALLFTVGSRGAGIDQNGVQEVFSVGPRKDLMQGPYCSDCGNKASYPSMEMHPAVSE